MPSTLVLNQVFWAWLLLVAAFDMAQRRIPNALVLPGLAGALAALTTLGWSAGPSHPGWASALLAGGLAFAALLPCYAKGWMGAGDVKLAGVLGLWLGAPTLLTVWVIASLLAGLHSLVWLAARHGLAQWAPAHGQGRLAAPRFMPYGAYLALGALVVGAWNHVG